MKWILGVVLTSALVAGVGCTTPNTNRDYAADQPPPLDSANVRPKSAPQSVEGKSRVSADSINEVNLYEQAQALDTELDQGIRKASAKVGK